VARMKVEVGMVIQVQGRDALRLSTCALNRRGHQ
jgi:hypothetical protein